VRVTGLSLSPEAYYPYVARFPELQDVSFENAQARARTTELMQEGFVIGTGDMSELALGWATYNADHMAMYNPNAGVPKTLVKHLIGWYANHRADPALKQVLRDILDTPVSPELRSPNADGTIAQVTEQFVGPYILTDFFLFHYVRYGFSARKIYELACATFAEGTPGVDVFERPEIKKWLRLFFERFFAQQYKRTVIPAGPKIGSVSLSSRGDWRMPDEASVRSELDGIEGWP
jgi:NAD+ synthase (glutamine-hydrolysing)